MASSVELEMQQLLERVRIAEQKTQLAEQETQLAEQKTQLAEQKIQQAEQRIQRAELDRRQAEQTTHHLQQETQNATLKEYLYACHQHLYLPLTIETNPILSTKGTIKATARWHHPNFLKPWESFIDLQQSALEALGPILSGTSPERHFNSLLVFKGLRQLVEKKIGSEKDLEKYEGVAVESRVEEIIGYLKDDEYVKEKYTLGQGVVFDNHTNTLSDGDDEVQDSLRHQQSVQHPQTPANVDHLSDSKPSRTNSDQICSRIEGEGRPRSLLFIAEYKPPHKLPVGSLQRGFQELDVKKHCNQSEIPPEEEEMAIYYAKNIALAVAVQTFHYMIEQGLEYGYISTGEALVFLHVNWEDPTTLYFHLAVPREEAGSADSSDFAFQRTTVSQVLGLCLLASKSRPVPQKKRNLACGKLTCKPASDEATLQQIPPSVRKTLFTPCSEYKYTGPRIEIGGVRQIPTRSNPTCKEDTGQKSYKDSDDDTDQSNPDTPSKPDGGSRIAKQGRSRRNGKDTADQGKYEGGSKPSGSKGRGNLQHYCTQKCLMGIARRWPLDDECPNVSLHRRHGGRHAINSQKFKDLVQKQLAEDLDHDCEPLGLQGARGALFKLTLTSYGYVFVGKGTVRAFIPDLLHEGTVYKQLAKLQGTAVPVYLGNINLTYCYFYDIGVRILHMLLMSWGGQIADDDLSIKEWEGLEQEILRTVADVRRVGIDQADVRGPNILWNREQKRVMLIDFERAKKLPTQSDMLPEISPNKKQRFTLQEISAPNKKRSLPRSGKAKKAARAKRAGMESTQSAVSVYNP